MRNNDLQKEKSELTADKELHIVSTGQQTAETLVSTITAIHKDVHAIRLREKTWTVAKLIRTIKKLIDNGIPREKIIVHDRANVAHTTGVGGVQLSYHSMNAAFVTEAFPSLHVGCSVHALDEAMTAEAEGAHHLLYGHLFPTASKPNKPPKGPANLQEVIKNTTIPVIAIGGITPVNTPDVLNAGAKGVAVMSGILLADDPIQAVHDYRKAVQSKEVIP